MKSIIFLRTAWMIDYQGVTDIDKPNGAGSYVKENQDGGEVVNFYPVNNRYYGYARIRKGQNLRIERLGASKTEPLIKNVTVVFFATNPTLGGQYVVGWYDNAIVYRSLQSLKSNKRLGYTSFIVETERKFGTLLRVNLRKFEIPDDGPGQTNAWYVMEYDNYPKFINKFEIFKQDPKSYKRNTAILSGSKRGWQVDAEKRKKVEVAAMDATYAYFNEKGFDVKYVHLTKVGWDLEAKKGNLMYKLEVKGTSNDLYSVELTPNEFHHSNNHSNYRVCIFENALDRNKCRLHICKLSHNNKHWISELGDKMKVIKITSAQLLREPMMWAK